MSMVSPLLPKHPLHPHLLAAQALFSHLLLSNNHIVHSRNHGRTNEDAHTNQRYRNGQPLLAVNPTPRMLLPSMPHQVRVHTTPLAQLVREAAPQLLARMIGLISGLLKRQLEGRGHSVLALSTAGGTVSVVIWCEIMRRTKNLRICGGST